MYKTRLLRDWIVIERCDFLQTTCQVFTMALIRRLLFKDDHVLQVNGQK